GSRIMVTSTKRRGGFTLVELLVVIAIIAVLVALAAGGAFRLIASQRISRTEDALRVTDKALREHWKKVVEGATAESKTPVPSDAVMDLAAGNADIARVLWVKIRLTEAFPQSYAEIANCFSGTAAVLNTTIYGNDSQGRPWILPKDRKYMATYYNAIK